MWALCSWLAVISFTTTLVSADISTRSLNGGVIRGVNLGGWLVAEQWITPSLFRGIATDEWGLCYALGKDRCRSTLQNHWSTFFTWDDFSDIKKAGLNSVRIPVGYWAVDVRQDEPYVSGQYLYLQEAVKWASDLGLSVLVDLHGAPGSQNGYDHSGLIGPVLFPTNTSNVDRTMAVLKNLTEEFAKPEYGGVVTAVEVLNEPRLSDSFTMSFLKQVYSTAYQTIRTASSNVNVTVHDAFWGPQYWANYDPSSASASRPASRLTIDTHQYYAFPPLLNLPQESILQSICNVSQILKSRNIGIPPTIVGEWSLESGRAPGVSSDQYRENSQAKRTWLRTMFEAQLAAYEPNGPGQPAIGWYYWTWKTQYDIDTWSYRRGVSQGYIPSDVSNSSTYAFPRLPNGCIDAGISYTAPQNPSSAQTQTAYRPDVIALALMISGIAYRWTP